MLDQDLVSYIQKQKAAGVSESTYRMALRSQGWSDEDITAASVGPIPTPAGIPVPPTQIQETSAGDRTLAAWSFWTLTAISVFHIIWLGFKNTHFLKSISQQGFTADGFFVWLIVIGLITLNFLPVLVTIKPYVKGRYKKQIITGIIAFIICQFVMHLIISMILGVLGAAAC